MRITFIGAGNMASALIGGLLANGHQASAIRAIDPSEEQRRRIAAQFGVACHSDFADSGDGDVVVLAVKPQAIAQVVRPLAGRVDDRLVISVAAGIRATDLSRWLGGHRRIVRCMPNTPALIGAGVTGLYADPSVDAAGREAAETILGAVGSTLWVDSEARIDAVTAISGSGPAYVFHFIEALEAAGRALGFDEVAARRLAIDTTLGAARLAAGSEEAPAVLRERVTSKGGTTAAALASLASSGWHDALVAAVKAAETRGRELGDELGKD